jgi:hypothetical protein
MEINSEVKSQNSMLDGMVGDAGHVFLVILSTIISRVLGIFVQ